MKDPFEVFLVQHQFLLSESTQPRDRERKFPIRITIDLPAGRSFENAWLILESGFPDSLAYIRLSQDAILEIPHVEYKGKLCIEKDLGPHRGTSPEDRIQLLLSDFYEEFLKPWAAGELDNDFEKEAQNYWGIHVNQESSKYDPISIIYSTEQRSPETRVYKSTLYNRILLAGTNNTLINRIVKSRNYSQNQQLNVLIADIPIDHDLIPNTWPRSEDELISLLKCRLTEKKFKTFNRTKSNGRSNHKVVLLRSPNSSFGFLLPGGPPAIIDWNGVSRKRASKNFLPLLVKRVDPSWTYGRDQLVEINARQDCHIVIFGAGALGSPVIIQLAKAGIGHISIVDHDTLSVANINRHELGMDMLGCKKANEIALRIEEAHPAVKATPFVFNAEKWLEENSLRGVDLILDLTGEQDVRFCIEQNRIKQPCPLLIGWMEPYVAAAHAALLPKNALWFNNNPDRLYAFQAFKWPGDVIQNEPACSSRFQCYTSAAAAHAVALVTEGTLALIDKKIDNPVIRSWVRGRSFIDENYEGVVYREWAEPAIPYDGISIERPING